MTLFPCEFPILLDSCVLLFEWMFFPFPLLAFPGPGGGGLAFFGCVVGGGGKNHLG